MRSNRLLKLLFVVAVTLAATSMYAQRQTPGRSGINGTFLLGPGFESPVAPIGGVLSWCNYQYSGHTALSVEVLTHPYYIDLDAVVSSTGMEVAPAERMTHRCYDLSVGAGYFFRLAATRSRSLIVSAGISGFVGLRHCNEIGTYAKGTSEDGKTEYHKPNGLILNFVPELQLEFFPFDSVSLFVTARPRAEALNVIIGGTYPWFTFNWGGGVKVYL